MSDKNIDFIDVNSVFLANDGQPRPELFVNDGQHHNDAGFKARAAIIMQHLPPKSE